MFILTVLAKGEKKLHNVTFSGLKMKNGKVVLTNGGSIAKIANIDIMLEKYKAKNNIVNFLNWARKSFEHRRDWEKRDDEETDVLYS